ncbi:MAG: hypothetical protein J5879_03095 [Clostridia bacterium]|nr:hypothetical protein [Clostridia bacterium]
MKKAFRCLCLLLCAALLLPLAAGAASDVKAPSSRLPSRLKKQLQVISFDFSQQMMSSYLRNENVAIGNRATMNVEDGTLRNISAQPLSFGSAVFVGDDYGLSEGYVSFDMQINSGAVSLGVRNTRAGAFKDGRGVWFSFDGSDTMTVKENDTGCEASVKLSVPTSGKVNVRFEERLDSMVVSVGGSAAATVTLSDGRVAFFDGDGKELCSKDGCGLYGSGYFTVVIDGETDGYIDDLVFTNYKADQSLPDQADRQIDYTTWTATDDLARTVSSNAGAGDVKENKYVGLFYFLCWVGAGVHVQDITSLYLDLGKQDLKKYLEKSGGESYWAEPYFGYYINTDKWVYRKHAYMLEAAGVDFIFLDVSNGATFDKGHLALFDTWLQIRREGGMTPQICFFCGDNPSTFDKDITHLRKTVYAPNNYDKYKELFFMWDGKPLIFGNASGVNEQSKEWLEDFTVRGNWAWCNKDNYWSWLQDYRYNEKTGEYTLVDGGKGRDADGNFEELAVCLGHHPATSKGRSYVNGTEPNTKKNDFNFSLEGSGEGKCFEFQFNAATSFDPTVMLITGWNEWIAGCDHNASNRFFAQTSVKGYMYVDQFNPEFSRDAEPMRLRDGVGFGDNYYYQMCDYIRKFKGIGKTTEATGQKSIDLCDISCWDSVGPEYKDNIGDVELRNTVSYDADYRYVNGSGRNDIDYAKVSQDSKNAYFLVKCTADIETADGKNFMNLFINTDGDASNGWEGYDLVLDRSRDGKYVSVERFKDGFESEKTGEAEYKIDGQYMVISVSKELLGVTELTDFTFKWADNSTVTGNVMEFMDLGDAAPNDRFAFRYIGAQGEDIRYESDTTDTEAKTEAEEGGGENLAGFITAVCFISAAVVAAAAVVIVTIKRKRG